MTVDERHPARSVWAGTPVRAAAALFFCALCVAFVDRPVADFAHARLHGSATEGVAIAILRTMDPILALLGLTALVLLVRMMSRRSRGKAERLAFAGSGAVVIAVALALVLKYLIGRSQLYPPYLLDHVYQFHPLRGGSNYMAFPSATMAGSAALLGVLWPRWPRLGAPGVAILLLIAACLVVTSSHWIADIVAGAALGALVGGRVASRWQMAP